MYILALPFSSVRFRASATTPVTRFRPGRYEVDCNALRGQLSNLIQKSSSRVVGHFNEPTASLSCHSTSLKLFRFLADVHFRSLSLSRERARVRAAATYDVVLPP